MKVESDGLPPIRRYLPPHEEKDLKLSRKINLVLSIVSFALGMFFWSAGITGNVVGNSGGTGATVFGGVLMAMAVVGLFLFVKNSRR